MTRLCPVSTRFLEIVFEDGKRFDHDVVVYPDGSIERRNKKPSKKYADLYGHTPVSREELEEYLSRADNPDCIFIGTGQSGAMPVTREAEELLSALASRGTRVYVLTTPELVSKCKELMRDCERPLMVIHVTC